jgi:predicted hydrocarbon binding protein
MSRGKTFVQRMEELRRDLQKRNHGFYVTGKYNKIRKGPDTVHMIPIQELYIGSLTLSPGYATILYNLGKMSGEYTTRKSISFLKLGPVIRGIIRLTGPYGVLKRESLTRNIINSWENMGYGHIRIKKVDARKKEVTFVIEESVFAAGMKNVGEKICFNQAGLLAGIMKGISGKEFYSIETKCIANGDKYCEFLVREESTKGLK